MRQPSPQNDPADSPAWRFLQAATANHLVNNPGGAAEQGTFTAFQRGAPGAGFNRLFEGR